MGVTVRPGASAGPPGRARAGAQAGADLRVSRVPPGGRGSRRGQQPHWGSPARAGCPGAAPARAPGDGSPRSRASPPTHRGRERPPGRGRGCTWGAPGRSARSSASWSSSSAPPGAPASPSSLPAELGPWPSPSASSSQVESQSGSSMLSAGGARAGRKLPGREEARGRGGAGLRARGRGGGAPSGARLPCTSRARGCP